MNADGSAKTLVLSFSQVGLGDGFVFARARHGGQYWFLLHLQVEGTFPDPTGNGNSWPRYALFALSEQGETVQLTDDPLFQVNAGLTANLRWTQRDGVVDGRITLVGRRWNSDLSAVVETGIYAIDLDPEGLPVSIGANLALPLTRLPINFAVTYDPQYGEIARVSGCDWSPDGTRLAYAQSGVIYIADLAGGDPLILVADPTPTAVHPRWSPPLAAGQTQIYFGSGIGCDAIVLEKINSDGTGRTVTLPPNDDKYCTRPDAVRWSPSGASVIFAEQEYLGLPWPYEANILSMPANGGATKDLTRSVSTFCYPRAWLAP